jgi:hypothetical protein
LAYDPYGGQTGSLTPRCGVAPLASDGTAVAAGDSIAVLYTSDCANTSITVIGPDGIPVAHSLEPIDDAGTYVVRLDATASPGNYAIALPQGSDAGSTEVTVGQAAPLPTTLGTLTADDVGSCTDTAFTLTLDPDALQFAPLIRLDASIDGGQWFTWVAYGALDLDGNQSTLELHCMGDCNLDGPHTLHVSAQLAGEPASFQTLSVPFTMSCPSPPGTNCSAAARAGRTRSTWPSAFVVALAFIGWRWRRRRDPPSG